MSKVCHVPFDTMYLHNGWASTCCPNWYDHYRKLPDYCQSPLSLWRNAMADELRSRVRDDDYTLCTKCPLVTKTGSKISEPEDWSHGPKTIHVADSFVCNLHCWSCRAGSHLSDGNDSEAGLFLWNVLDYFRDSLKHVTLLNSGELFASERHIRLLNNFDWGDIKIGVITNATLVDRRWNVIQKVHSSIERFIVSLDASNRETYEQVRLGGNWDAAVRGVELIASRELPLTFHYVISDKNVKDLYRFVEWALNYSPCEIAMIPLARTYDRTDWDDRDVFRPDHPLHSVLCNQLDLIKSVEVVNLLLPS